MWFGGNGAVVSPWSAPFFWFFSLFDFESCGEKEKKGGALPTGPPIVEFDEIEREVTEFHAHEFRAVYGRVEVEILQINGAVVCVLC